MGNFLQEFDRSNGYVLFFISLPMVAYLRKLKQRKKKKKIISGLVGGNSGLLKR